MNRQHARLLQAMTAYDRGDARRIQHFIKVHDLAAAIGAAEGLSDEELFILETAALLHDIGIHKSEQLYGDTGGKHQEELGPAEARMLMHDVGGYTDAQTERVCFLIAHHHSYTGVVGMDWQILLEADFLVNAYEDQLNKEAIRRFENNVFRTATGKRLLSDMFGL